MHICVCVKQTPDSSSVYIDPVSGSVDEERFVQVLNPADACAVEAATRLKEHLGGTILALTVGPVEAEGAVRAALALGADKAIRLWSSHASTWGPFAVAAALAGCIVKEAGVPDIVLCGDAASDWSSGVVGPALAERLGLPQITGVTQLIVQQDQEHIILQVTRKLERGYRELLNAQPPLLLTVTPDLNEPRYPSLPAHMAALKATIPILDAQALLGNIPVESEQTTLLEMHMPRPLPRRIAAPDSHHSAFERIGEILAGGATGKKTKLVEGSPEELAEALVEFLKSRGFLF